MTSLLKKSYLYLFRLLKKEIARGTNVRLFPTLALVGCWLANSILPASAQPSPPAPAVLDSSTVLTSGVTFMPSLRQAHGYTSYIYATGDAQDRLNQSARMRARQREGYVKVYFVVGPSGTVYGRRLLTSLSPVCDSLAMAALLALPRFRPAQLFDGRIVTVGITDEFHFYGPAHVYDAVEVKHKALFPGPLTPSEYVRQHTRVPPKAQPPQARRGTQVRYQVDAAGRVREARIDTASGWTAAGADGTWHRAPACPACDQEAVRVVQSMPAWQPATIASGEAVVMEETLDLYLPPLPPPIPQVEHYKPAVGLPPNYRPLGGVYTYVEQMPQLAEGSKLTIFEGIQQRLRLTAQSAATCAGKQVQVQFVVEASGQVSHALIEQGVAPACDEAVLAAVRRLPRLVPGR